MNFLGHRFGEGGERIGKANASPWRFGPPVVPHHHGIRLEAGSAYHRAIGD